MSGRTPLEEARDRLLAFLASQHVEHMLLGGLAIRLHAIPRPTYDIDLLVGVPDEDVGRVAAAAVAAAPTLRARRFRSTSTPADVASLGYPP